MPAQPVWRPSVDSQQPLLALCMCLLSARTLMLVTLVCAAVLMVACTHGSKRKCVA